VADPRRRERVALQMIKDEAFERELEATREDMIQGWHPPAKPHCSNCYNCKVSGTPAEPQVYCALGYGNKKWMPLWTVIRPTSSRQFIPARDCGGFASMTDGVPWPPAATPGEPWPSEVNDG